MRDADHDPFVGRCRAMAERTKGAGSNDAVALRATVRRSTATLRGANVRLPPKMDIRAPISNRDTILLSTRQLVKVVGFG